MPETQAGDVTAPVAGVLRVEGADLPSASAVRGSGLDAGVARPADAGAAFQEALAGGKAHLGELLERTCEEIKGRPNVPELPTGFGGLDGLTFGIWKSEVLLLAGRPSEGKSSVALHIAQNLADRQKKVLYLSLEMSNQQLMERLIAKWTDIPAKQLRQGKVPPHFDTLVTPLRYWCQRVPLLLVEHYGHTLDEVREGLERFKARFNSHPDCLIIDYLQLTEESGTTDVEKLNTYMRGLKRLVLKYHVALILLTQLNRSLFHQKDQEPELHMLKGSGSQEEIADCVVMLWWKTLPQEPDADKVEYTLKVVKNRHGELGKVFTQFEPKYCRFKDDGYHPDEEGRL